MDRSVGSVIPIETMGCDSGLDIPSTWAAASTALQLYSSEGATIARTQEQLLGPGLPTITEPFPRWGDHQFTGGGTTVQNAKASPPLQMQRPQAGNWNWLT